MKRFWDKVDVRGPSACWLWKGAVSSSGYGNFGIGSRMVKAHRFAFELKIGKIPNGKIICHTCDNPLCCNPSHLWVGTDLENNHDMIRKGRRKYGNARLTPEQVAMIRKRVAAGELQRDVKQDFGLSSAGISNIVNRKRWSR